MCTHENQGSLKRTSVLADIYPPQTIMAKEEQKKGVQKRVHENRSWQKKAYKCGQYSIQIMNLLFCLPFFAIQNRFSAKLKRWQNHSSEKQNYFQLSQIAFGTPWHKVPDRSCICRNSHSHTDENTSVLSEKSSANWEAASLTKSFTGKIVLEEVPSNH